MVWMFLAILLTLLVTILLHKQNQTDLEIRTHDVWGGGQWLASRGNRPHLGVDIVVDPAEIIRAPFDMEIVRRAFPYSSDLSYTGIKFRTVKDNITYTGRLFYFVPYADTGVFQKGDPIGVAQDLTTKYQGITNHVHLDIRSNVSHDIDNEYYYNGVYYTDPNLFL
jgi:hypothetical protein